MFVIVLCIDSLRVNAYGVVDVMFLPKLLLGRGIKYVLFCLDTLVYVYSKTTSVKQVILMYWSLEMGQYMVIVFQLL